MTPAEVSPVEAVLRRAYADAAATVQPSDVRPAALAVLAPWPQSSAPDHSGRNRRWLVAGAAGAAAATVSLVAALIVPHALHQQVSLAAVPRHMAYVVQAGEVRPVNIATGVPLRPIKLGVPGESAGAVITPDGRSIYVANVRGYVVPVDTVTRKAGRPIWIGGVPKGMLMNPDGRTGYVIEPPYGVAVVDLALNRPAGFVKIKGAWNFALTPNGKTLYVVSWSGLVTPLETATLTALRPIKTSGYPGGRAQSPGRPGDWPSGVALLTVPSIAVAPNGKTAYAVGVVGGATDVLTPINTATNTALAPIRIPNGQWQAPVSFSPDGRTGYLAGDEVAAVNLMAGSVSWTFKLPGRPPFGYQTEVSPDGQTVYILATGSGPGGAIYRIPAATGIPRATPIQIGRVSPFDNELDLSPDGKTLYVQSFPANNAATVASFDAATGRPGRIIHISWPGTVLFGPS